MLKEKSFTFPKEILLSLLINVFKCLGRCCCLTLLRGAKIPLTLPRATRLKGPPKAKVIWLIPFPPSF